MELTTRGVVQFSLGLGKDSRTNGGEGWVLVYISDANLIYLHKPTPTDPTPANSTL